jgi:hypothetical protein
LRSARSVEAQVLCFDVSNFRWSHHMVNVRARSYCFSRDELFGQSLVKKRGRYRQQRALVMELLHR